MRNRILLVIVFVVGIFIDQITKIAVDASFSLYSTRPILGDILRLTYIRNPGSAFGISFGSPVVMLVITIAVNILIACLVFSGSLRPETSLGQTALVLVFAGGIGNLIDRIRLGEVIDFLDMGFGNLRWPVYNMADIYVTVGMALLLYTYVFTEQKHTIS